jgi:hypothetical protein
MPKASTEIRVIGARSSGKTTYLATLAVLPSGLLQKYPNLEVIPRNDEATALRKRALDTITNQGKIAGDAFDADQLHNLKDYDFLIKIPRGKKRSSIELELLAKDFPGEFFEHIPIPHQWKKITPWVDDLFTTVSWMVMMTDWEPERDTSLYLPAFTKLCEEIREREIRNPEIEKLRIAVVMAKCERGELWPCRLDPDEDLFEVRLPETYKHLTKTLTPDRLQFFACSAFGVLGSRRDRDFDPRPNCYLPDDGSPEEKNAYLREPDRWYPYGLIPPLYWLATGIRLEE